MDVAAAEESTDGVFEAKNLLKSDHFIAIVNKWINKSQSNWVNKLLINIAGWIY